MAGTIVADTLQDGAGNSTSMDNAIYGSAKAWVNFTGSSATINGSYNISSVTRNSTGNYTIAYTTALSNSNYSVLVCGNRTAGSPTDNFSASFWSPSTTGVSVCTAGPTSVSYYDANLVTVAIFR